MLLSDVSCHWSIPVCVHAPDSAWTQRMHVCLSQRSTRRQPHILNFICHPTSTSGGPKFNNKTDIRVELIVLNSITSFSSLEEAIRCHRCCYPRCGTWGSAFPFRVGISEGDMERESWGHWCSKILTDRITVTVCRSQRGCILCWFQLQCGCLEFDLFVEPFVCLHVVHFCLPMDSKYLKMFTWCHRLISLSNNQESTGRKSLLC